MLITDPTLIGRTYYTLDKKTTYTIRGFAIAGTIVVIGEYADPQVATETKLATHKLAGIHLIS